jgi:2-dehydro-3-deoxyphosphogluconate aldolase / (4S)-4-hydroxy-2-oxoglutarate aldolase
MSDDSSPALPFPGRILPVVAIAEDRTAVPLAEALLAGGCTAMEITLRSTAAIGAIRRAAAHGGIVVGAGTVISPAQVDAVFDAGATFVVSPGLDEQVLARCRELGVPAIPGVATATEVQHALALGVTLLKLFPAEASGGIALLRALAAPFPQVRFVPTGGLTAENAASYLAERSVAAIGGSWMVARPLLDAQDWDRVTELTRAAVAAAHEEAGR